MENQIMESAEKQSFTITAVKQAASGCVEITTDGGPVFFIRAEYLEHVLSEKIVPGSTFCAEDADDIISAGFAFAAERKAIDYLSRSEQCRFGLEGKLAAKSFDKNAVKKALDYLESRKYLDDSRFAISWLRIRAISKCQGRTRLAKELAARGVNRKIAEAALDEFFEQNCEEDLCRKAYKKAVRSGKQGLKLVKYLVDSGFSYRMVKSLFGDNEEIESFI